MSAENGVPMDDKCPKCGSEKRGSGWYGTLFKCGSILYTNYRGLSSTEPCEIISEKNLRIAELEAELVKAKGMLMVFFDAGMVYGFDDARSVGNRNHETTTPNFEDTLHANGLGEG